MSKFKVGDVVDFKYAKGGNGLITGVAPFRNPYKYWVEYETDEGLEGEYYSEKELILVVASDEAQLLMFWNLQLRFMSMETFELVSVAFSMYSASSYVENGYTEKFSELIWKWAPYITEDEHNCIATHLAAQLSGIEE